MTGLGKSIAVAALAWPLKGDGQAARWFVGRGFRLCTTFGLTFQRKNFPENP